MTDRFVIIATYGDVIEANLAKALLEQEGIDSLLEEENVAALDYWAASFLGAKLKVKETDVERATQILDQVSGSDDPAGEMPAED